MLDVLGNTVNLWCQFLVRGEKYWKNRWYFFFLFLVLACWLLAMYTSKAEKNELSPFSIHQKLLEFFLVIFSFGKDFVNGNNAEIAYLHINKSCV